MCGELLVKRGDIHGHFRHRKIFHFLQIYFWGRAGSGTCGVLSSKPLRAA
jgi:hypothetical protein